MIRGGIVFKICALCKRELPRGCFYKHRDFVDGFNNKCKKCSRVTKMTGMYRDKKFAKKQVMRYGHAKI